ncbi:hypothetical protein JZ751_018633, partial [Albula glossodonta]
MLILRTDRHPGTMYQCGWTEGVVVAAAGSITNVTVGERVLFPVSDEGMSHNYAIKLKFNSTTLFSWSSRLNVSDVRDSYKHRIGILQNGSIYMNDVQLNDSGVYLSETHDKSGFKSTKSSNFHLQVFEPVSKPNIAAECLNGSISLSCFSSEGSEVTYSWETLPPCGDDSCVHLGATVEIHPSSESTAHTCTAQNPVSRATSDPIDLGVCSIHQPPGIWVAVLCALMSVTFLLGSTVFYYKKRKRDRRKRQTIHCETELAFTQEEPSAVPFIDPVYVSTEPVKSSSVTASFDPVYVSSQPVQVSKVTASIDPVYVSSQPVQVSKVTASIDPVYVSSQPVQ